MNPDVELSMFYAAVQREQPPGTKKEANSFFVSFVLRCCCLFLILSVVFRWVEKRKLYIKIMVFSFISHCGNKNRMFVRAPSAHISTRIKRQRLHAPAHERSIETCVCVCECVACEMLAPSPLIMFNLIVCSTPRMYQFTSLLLPLGIRYFRSLVQNGEWKKISFNCAVLNTLRLCCAVYPVGKQRVVAFFSSAF